MRPRCLAAAIAVVEWWSLYDSGVPVLGAAASGIHVVVAGLIVGIGTRLGAGCTSGHGVCGLSRLSPRSIVATGTFMTTGFATVTLMRLAGVVA